MTVDATDLRLASALALVGGIVLPFLPGDAGLPCPLRTATGIPCPLCGMTTSVEATMRLDLADALAANPGGIAVVLAAVVLLAFRPKRIPLPLPLLYVALFASWIFELDRFAIV